MYKPQDVFRYCPRCGNADFAFDGGRSFKCSACEFHFYVNSSAAVAAIIHNNDGEILFTIRAQEPQKGFWDLPGGFVDPMESAETALIREIREELNLKVARASYLCSYPNEYLFSGLVVYTTDLGFVVDIDEFDGILAADDITGYMFVHPSKIDFSKIGAPSIVQIVNTYISSINKDVANC